MPFGFGKKDEKPECKYDIKYIGGHKAFPKGKDTEALIFPDRLEIKKAMIIPYSSITDIENMEDHRITKTRAFLTPFFLGLFWKKNYLYTVIDYNDGRDNQSIVLDFHRSAEEAQRLIYERTLDTRTPSLLAYENSTYGIKMKYPSTWDKQEGGTNQNIETDIITFYPPVSNSSGSLTASIEDVSNKKDISLPQYVTDRNESLQQSLKDFKLIESNTSTVLAGLDAYKLTYTDVDQKIIIRNMEIGTIKGNKTYKLLYAANMNEYRKYLPVIQDMINSFQLTT